MATRKPPVETPDVGIADLLAAKEMIIVCGSGGVGKTTMAAALGAQAVVEIGGRVLVLTVDPAKRLANALGLQAFGNTETRVRVLSAAFHPTPSRSQTASSPSVLRARAWARPGRRALLAGQGQPCCTRTSGPQRRSMKHRRRTIFPSA